MEETQIKHNWLYSVVPAFPVQEQYFAGGIYLSGYCKQCRSYFTARLIDDGGVNEVRLGKLDIPVYGCVPLE